MLPPEIAQEIASIAEDRTSGATALVLRGIAALQRAGRHPEVLRQAALALCEAQPSMAGFRTAAALALTGDGGRQLERLAERIRRVPAAVARVAIPIIRLRRATGSAVRLVTCSRSAVVEHTLLALARSDRIEVCCAESQPGREGTALAGSLAGAAVPVILFTDAGIGTAVRGADAVVLGADALSSTGFINKAGSAQLAALARASAVPVLVLAGREKVLPERVFASLRVPDGPPDEVVAPEGVAVRNPYFEVVPAEFASQVICDAAAVPPDSVLEVGMWSSAALVEYERYMRR